MTHPSPREDVRDTAAPAPDLSSNSNTQLSQVVEKQPAKEAPMELTPYSPHPQGESTRSQSSPRKNVWKIRWFKFIRGLGLILYWIARIFVFILCGIGILALAW